MSLRLVIASLLSAGAQAFAPTPIRWGGAVDKRFILAPASRGSAGMSTVRGPQKLKIWDQTGVISDTEIPHFKAKLDSTIVWDAKGLCIEASGTASGDTVQLNFCTGEATQTWNWLPWGPLQLRGTNQCVGAVHNSGSNGAPIVLRECEHGVTDSWAFEDPAPLPTPRLATFFESLHHVMVRLTALAVLGFFGLGAHVYRLQQKSRSFATGQVRLMDEGGVCLSEHIVAVTRNAEGSAQHLVPTAMALSPPVELQCLRQPQTNRRARSTDVTPEMTEVKYDAKDDRTINSFKDSIWADASKVSSVPAAVTLGPVDEYNVEEQVGLFCSRESFRSAVMCIATADMADVEAAGRVVILGAGLQGAALAYYLTLRGVKPVVVERKQVAAAASGKGGGFLARDWGNRVTKALHEESFKLHEELASELGIESYRRLPVLQVEPGERTPRTRDICPWLDGNYADCEVMDSDGGAQVAPYELCTKLMDAAIANGAELRIGAAEGVKTRLDDGSGLQCVDSVIVDGEVVKADRVCVCMGPWAALAQDWFSIPVPMTGVKSTSIVFKKDTEIEPYALFCGEDDRFGTHLEVYPRNNGEVYLCGIGGSQYVDGSELRAGSFPPGEVYADPKRVQAAAASFSEMSKQLGGEPDSVQACMRPCPPDGLPIMGKVGHIKGAYISAGHNCWGILWAPVSGKAMSELIVDGKATTVDLRHFSPGRFASEASVSTGKRGRKMGSVPVGEQW